MYGIAVSTLETYLVKHFDASKHADVFCQKLGLTLTNVYEAYHLMRASQTVTKTDNSVKSAEFTSSINAALGTNCTLFQTATHSLGRLYLHYFTQ